MKMQIVVLLLTFVCPVAAAEIDGGSNACRYVADDIEIVSLPNGAVMARLVSRKGVTERQFWIDSVYHNRESILVFQSQGMATQDPTIAARAAQGEMRSHGFFYKPDSENEDMVGVPVVGANRPGFQQLHAASADACMR